MKHPKALQFPILILIVVFSFSTRVLAQDTLPSASVAEVHALSALRPNAVAVVPIQIVHNRFHVTFEVGGEQLNCLLDTGATSSIFFHSAKFNGQELTFNGEAKVLFPALDKQSTGKRIEKLDLKAGDFTFTSKGGLLIEDSRPSETGYDAIIGQELFRNYTVEIHPGEKVMLLYKPGTDLSEFFNQSQQLYMEDNVPHIKFLSKMPWETHYTSKSLLLDTGYPGSMVIWSGRHYRLARRTGSFIEKIEGSGGIVSHIKLDFGDLTFNNIPVFIANRVPEQAQKRDGILGSSLLAQHHHVIDFALSRILMRSVIGKSGRPLQIIDGRIYTPNNETFDLKSFEPKPTNMPTLVVSGSADGDL